MQDIKFRSWNKDLEIMCYEDEDSNENYWDGVYSSAIGLINHQLNKNGYYRSCYDVMQYTGLNDKNGKEAYKSDLIKINETIYEIVFVNGCFKIKNVKYHSSNLCLLENYIGYFEVVGDIYQNKELLEGK